MAEVKAADAGRWQHGHAFCHAHPHFRRAQELEQALFDAVVGAGWVAWRRTDAHILLFDELLVRQALVRRITPKVTAHARVQIFGKGFGQTIGQAFEHDVGVVVELGQKLLLLRLSP